MGKVDKAQALYNFWATFDLPVYDEQTVPDEATPPYITYETITDSLGNSLPLTGSLWYRSNSWEDITKKAQQIASYIGEGGVNLGYENGSLWIRRGSSFAQRISDPNDDGSRRIYININAEFLGSN